MPVAVPLIAAAAGSAVASSAVVAATLGSTFAASIAGFVVSTALSQLGAGIFQKKPKLPSFSQASSGISTMVRSSVESHKVVYGEARVSGPINYPSTTNSGMNSIGTSVSGENIFFHYIIPLTGHEVDSMPTVYLDDNETTIDANGWVTSSPYYKDGLSYVRIKKHLGHPDQVADTDLVAELGVSSEFRGRGIAYVYVRLQWNADIFPTGIPNVSVVVRGKKVYDPRTGLTDWSDNAALCIRDYIASDYGFNCQSDEINDDYFIAAANACDESISLQGGGSQSRYTCNGVVDTALGPLDNLNGLLSSLIGTVTYVQGKFRLYAGVYHTPEGDISTEINQDITTSELNISLRTDRQSLFNAVQGIYIDPDKGWQPTDFPPVTNSTYETQDGGERIYKDIELPYTNHPEAAQRIAKVMLEKSRQGIIVEVAVNDSALRYTAFDVIRLTDSQMGWDSKPFRILNWSQDALGAIKLLLQEEASASYDWNNGEATVTDPAPDTNLPNPFSVSVPTGVSYNSRAVNTKDGDTLYNLAMQWSEHPNSFVTDGGQFEIQYKLSADTEYKPSFLVPGDLTESDIITSDVNVFYDLRIRAVNTLGIKSNWVTILNAVVGSSGGVGATEDWGNWTDSVGTTEDWGNWVDSPSAAEDWEFFT